MGSLENVLINEILFYIEKLTNPAYLVKINYEENILLTICPFLPIVHFYTEKNLFNIIQILQEDV